MGPVPDETVQFHSRYDLADLAGALIGGIDAGALCRDENAVRETIEETVPQLLEGGRYLPCLDDRPRSNISFARYKLFREVLEKM